MPLLFHTHISMTRWWSGAGHSAMRRSSRDNEAWVMRPDRQIVYWDLTYPLLGDVTLIRCGGHFPGSTVLHWPGADGKGVLMTGDTIMVVADTRWVTFMYSYSNDIPLNHPPWNVLSRRWNPSPMTVYTAPGGRK